MNDIKIVFMGTPEFSVPILKCLIDSYQVIGVVTQPDALIGRKKELIFSPIKKLAIENNIKVFQPEKIKNDYQEILNLNPDIIITCAYGQIIPKEILDYPKYGCINVHASLLPKLRGGAPIHHAIIDGYKETGITIMYMDTKMDNGDIISQEKIVIEDDFTTAILHDKLSIMGSNLLLKTLPLILNGTNERIKQNESEVTFGYNISKDDEHIDFSKTAKEVFNQIRGLNSWPGAYAVLDGKRFKIWQSKIGNNKSNEKNGTIANIYNDGIGVICQDKEIIITEIQPEGKKKISVKEYLNGIKKEQLLGRVFE